jgi:hypothetical protein
MAMDFRTATDALLDSTSHEALAKSLGVSVATVRQARLAPSAKAHRSPPAGWESVILRLAKQRLTYFKRLVERLERR